MNGAAFGLNTIDKLTRCPDCNSTTELVETQPGVYEARVFHDNTCPWFNRKGPRHEERT